MPITHSRQVNKYLVFRNKGGVIIFLPPTQLLKVAGSQLIVQ